MALDFPQPSTSIWLTCQDTLQLLNAGEEGRAVLLNNYLLALDYETYLALGMAVPDGETVQLLFKDKLHSDTYWLLNSTSGRRTNVKDCTGSMQQIWALVSQDNFWVNSQSRSHPSQISYQLGKLSDWRPLFSRRLPNPRSESVQSLDIQYVETSAKDVQRLEEAIANHLKQSFMKWRKTRRTRWNRHSSQVFRAILQQLGRDAVFSSSPDLDRLSETFKVIIHKY